MSPFDPKDLFNNLVPDPDMKGGQNLAKVVKLATAGLPIKQDLDDIEIPDFKASLAQAQKLLQRRTIRLRHIHGCNCKPCPAGHYVDEEGNMYKNFDEGMSEGLEMDTLDPRLEKTNDANMDALEQINATLAKSR